VARECGDRWAGRHHFKTKPTVRAHLRTVGSGDITPVFTSCALVAAMEAMTGLLYVAVLIAQLVSLYSRAKSDDA